MPTGSLHTGCTPVIDTYSEAVRTGIELLALNWSRSLLIRSAHQGHGKPVLVLPGLGGGDLTTKPLRDLLNEKGFRALGWGAGINTGPNRALLSHLSDKLARMHRDHGGQKIALVGHSLGGVFARELARSFPDKVSQVVTLGSPFGAGDHPDSLMPFLKAIFNAVNAPHNPLVEAELTRQALIPPPVPTTALYTRHDGVVHWRVCINPDLPDTENIEVHGSHCGLIVNPTAMLVVLDRLAQNLDEQPWARFDSRKYHPLLLPLRQAHDGHMPPSPNAGGHPTIRLFQ